MSDFGTGFRKARESLGISLDEIANETRIGTRFLQAIESEEFQRLPGGVFNRGVIRAIAERVGLDPDAALAEYDRLVRIEEVGTIPRSAPQHTRIDRALYPIALGALVLLVLGFYIFNRGAGSGTATTAPPPAEVTSAPMIMVPVEPVVEAAPEPAPAEPAPPVVQKPALAIEMAATEETWVRISSDGAAAIDEILQPGTTRNYTAQKSLDIKIGNAGGVTLKVNDRQVRSLGRRGQVREFLLTPDNVNDIDKIIVPSRPAL